MCTAARSALLAFVVALVPLDAAAASATKPHIVFMVVDDLGERDDR